MSIGRITLEVTEDPRECPRSEKKRQDVMETYAATMVALVLHVMASLIGELSKVM
jgi:hypothetical protein